jgi:ABC-type protease/lipase transport system fused ATPase/permease subunit
LARAVFGDPAFVVLDEPNSNLDGDGELALMRAVQELKKRKCTVVMVAHQPNLVRVADKVLVLRDGAVAMFGPREDVLKALLKSSSGAKAPQPAEESGAAKTLKSVPGG